MVTHPSILLIEDSPGECELFRLALAQTGLDVTLYTEQGAEVAFRFLENQWAAPAVVPLRASNEGSPRPRVARAQDQAGVVHSLPSTSTETLPAASPSLILLDLNLRGQDGCDFLKRLRSDPRFAAIPIVIFTTSDDQQDLARCYASGANGYVIKPGTFAELVQCTQDICHYWLNRNRVPYIDMAETPC